MRKIYCIGETVYDIIFKDGKPVAAKAGGSMLNTTVSLGRAKLPVHFISEYANDNIGKQINSFLNLCNVNTNHVYRYDNGKTSIAIAFLNENNDASYTFYKDIPANRLKIDFPQPGVNDIVLFGSFYSINKEIRQLIFEFVLKAKQNGALIIYDPNFRKAHFHELIELKSLIIENLKIASIVRGSNEDFQMIFNSIDIDDSYFNVSKYCAHLIYTMNAKGVYLKSPELKIKVDVPKISTISTIGAGDNFNAGLIFGLIKNNIFAKNLNEISEEIWIKLLRSGADFASEVCLSYDNYISEDFANQYLLKWNQ